MDEFRTDVKLVLDKELTLAKTLIAALAKPFEPGRRGFTLAVRVKAAEQEHTIAFATPTMPLMVMSVNGESIGI